MTTPKNSNARSKYLKLPIADGLEGLSATSHNSSFPAHFHPSYNLTLVHQGTFISQLQDRTIMAPSGSLLLTHPNEVHANPLGKGEELSFFTFYLPESFLKFCGPGAQLHFPERCIGDPHLFQRLQRISASMLEMGSGGQLEKELKAALGYWIGRYAREPLDIPERSKRLFDELLQKDRLDQGSVAATARKMGMDPYKFIRLFKSYTGFTPANYFIFKRVEKSKALLSNRAELLDVAVELGFYDAAHFSHHFKKYIGVPPKAFAGM